MTQGLNKEKEQTDPINKKYIYYFNKSRYSMEMNTHWIKMSTFKTYAKTKIYSHEIMLMLC